VARFFSILAKKKGNRISGSPWWAGAGEVIFATSLVLLGLVISIVVSALQIQRSTAYEWYIPIWAFVGELVIAAMLVVIGAWRIVVAWWRLGASVESRGALVARAREVNLLNEVRAVGDTLPFVPQGLGSQVDPGWDLKYRLRAAQHPGSSLLVTGLVCLMFVGVTTVLALLAWLSWQDNQIDWISIGLAVCMLVGAFWSIYVLVRQILSQTGIGPTRVEVAQYPLVPGIGNRLSIVQPARFRLRLVDVLLECVEEATYREGTDVRSEARMVYRQRLVRKRGQAVQPAEPFSAAVDFEVPPSVMHSLQTPNNKISWRIDVTCLSTGWPKFKRQFPVLVLPATAPRTT
jgi:hypothetical protein